MFDSRMSKLGSLADGSLSPMGNSSRPSKAVLYRKAEGKLNFNSTNDISLMGKNDVTIPSPQGMVVRPNLSASLEIDR